MPMYFTSGISNSIENSESNNYAAARIAAGDPATSKQLDLIDKFISAGKKDGWWDRVDEFIPLLGTTVAGVSVKVKFVTTQSCTFTGFTDADVKGDGDGFGPDDVNNSTKYGIANYDPSSRGIGLQNIFLAATNINDWGGAAFNSAGGDQIQIDSTNSAALPCLKWTQEWCSILGVVLTPYNERTIKCINYTPATYQHYLNTQKLNDRGVPYTNGAMPATGPQLKFWKAANSGADRWGTGRLGSVIIGQYMTNAQATALLTAMRELEDGLGRGKTRGSKMIAYGDSICAGYKLADTRKPINAWVPSLAAALAADYINLGVPSSRLTNDSNSPWFMSGLTRAADAPAYKPGNVFVCYGINDCRFSVAPATFGTDLQTLITTWTGYPHNLSKSKIVTGSIPYVTPLAPATLAQQQLFVDQAVHKARANGTLFADIWGRMYSAFMRGVSILDADGIHPKEAGHALIKDAFLEAIDTSNLIGYARGIDLNVVNTDRAIWIKPAKYRITKIVVCQPSADISTSTFTADIRTATAGGGSAIVTAVSKTGLTGATKATEQTVNAHDILSDLLYFRVTLSHGSAACVDVLIYGESIE